MTFRADGCEHIVLDGLEIRSDRPGAAAAAVRDRLAVLIQSLAIARATGGTSQQQCAQEPVSIDLHLRTHNDGDLE